MLYSPNFGKQTPCSRVEFDRFIASAELYGKSEEDTVGTMYFVMRNHSEVYAVFYNEEHAMMYTTKEALHVTDVPGEGIALSVLSFVLCDDYDSVLVTVSDDWSKIATSARITSKRYEVGKMLAEYTTANESGLAQVREKCATDFRIQCSDGEMVEVNKPVLAAVWPFFESMLSSGMRESSENTVRLEARKSTVEVMMRYLHGQHLDLIFFDAVELVVVAQMYQLPELLDIAERFLRSFDTSLSEAMTLWRKCYEAGNEKLRTLAVSHIQLLMVDTEEFTRIISELSKDDMMLLLQDLAEEARRKRSC